ncbi:hypothetical protein L596_016017 [Steinernema carpocapsae]|uniref:Uncharacterized protein n=1 Tax=Steinernema carpocapsae TaxID=34508 RepID=A0A4U5NHY4_STECR|nr:hypothetical protein L596_016017 [Steinernema carpocapsae]
MRRPTETSKQSGKLKEATKASLESKSNWILRKIRSQETRRFCASSPPFVSDQIEFFGSGSDPTFDFGLTHS